MATTDETFATFSLRIDEEEVTDETVVGQSIEVLTRLRDELRKSGHHIGEDVESHSFYGARMIVKDRQAEVAVLLQHPGPWLLTVTRKPSFWQKMTGTREDSVSVDFIRAVHDALSAVGAQEVKWFTRQAYQANL
jgi:hypothetical protein